MTEFTLRDALPEDSDVVYEWICDPRVRAAAFSSREISRVEHDRWFASKLNDPSCVYLMGESSGLLLGQVRLEIEGSTASVSIVLAPDSRGKGIGPQLLRSACGRCLRSHSVTAFRAYIRTDNPASMRAFEKAGFEHRQSLELKGVQGSVFELRETELNKL